MKCPSCHASETKVLDSRSLKQGMSIRRRRECSNCKFRFTTYEKIEINLPVVVKLDGRREEFNKKKLLGGLQKACQKRPISTLQIDKILESIETTLISRSSGEINTQEIGNLLMEHLYSLDPVAYIRFASVYLKFDHVEDFVKTVQFKDSRRDVMKEGKSE